MVGAELSFGITPRQGVYSSDSTPFADQGVPAVSFVRIAPPSQATIHNRYDTAAVLSPERLRSDGQFLTEFTRRRPCRLLPWLSPGPCEERICVGRVS